MHETRRRILEHLRTADTATVADLVRVTGRTAMTVRHHMSALRDKSLVEAGSRPRGRGRPRLLFRLSSSGVVALAGEAVDRLAGEMLAALRRDRDGALEVLLAGMAEAAAGRIADGVVGRPIEVRLEAAVGLLRSRGVAARWQADGEGYLVAAEGCPYARLGSLRSELCALDLAIVQRVVAAGVTPERWRAAEGGCLFRVLAR